jgi:hypothetical protein
MLALITALLPAAGAFCGTYVGSAEAELINRASQVVVAREGEQTTLTLVNDYEGDLLDFAVVIPVPQVLTEDDVSLVDSTYVARADAYSAPRLVSYTCDNFDSGWSDHDRGWGCNDKEAVDSASADDGDLEVEVVEAFTVGEYQFVILDAEQSADLYTWLSEQGYSLPAGAEALLDEYIEGGSYFLAARVTLEAADDEETWLSPIQLRYTDPAFSLPIRIGTISSPGRQDLIIYAITSSSDGAVGISNYTQVALDDECMWPSEDYGEFGDFYLDALTAEVDDVGGAGWVQEYSWAPTSCDPCSSDPLDSSELSALGFDGGASDAHFTRLHVQYTPEAATQDLMLYTTGIGSTDQVRYITYDHDLEDRYPICGEGWAEDPGSCFETSGEGGGGCAVSPWYLRPRMRWRFGLGSLMALTLGGILLRRR